MRICALSTAIFLSILASMTPANAEDGYAVLSTAIPHSRPAPLDWDIDKAPIDRGLSLRILDQLEYTIESQNLSLRFAGHYMVAKVGCGGYLQCGVLIDVLTGRPVIRLPDTSTGYKYWPDRHLLVVNPYQSDHYQIEGATTSYYVWSGGRLIFLAEEPWPDASITGSIE